MIIEVIANRLVRDAIPGKTFVAWTFAVKGRLDPKQRSEI